MATSSDSSSADAFISSARVLCRRFGTQVLAFQERTQRSGQPLIASDVEVHLEQVFEALKSVSSLVWRGSANGDSSAASEEASPRGADPPPRGEGAADPSGAGDDLFAYEFLSQLLVLAWRATVCVADLVTLLQERALTEGTWLRGLQPSAWDVVPLCLQGYRLHCRIAEEGIAMVKSGMRMHWHRGGAEGSRRSMLMLMHTRVDGEREVLEDWLKTLHNDMSNGVQGVDKSLTLLSYPAAWERERTERR